MIDRITKRLPNGGVMYDNGEYCLVCYPWNEHCLSDIDRMAIRLCELEDKIEQGALVELPCKVGQAVYCVRYDKARKPFVKPLGVLSVTMYGKGGFTVFTTKEDTLGKTVFLTREEAERVLERRENGT